MSQSTSCGWHGGQCKAWRDFQCQGHLQEARALDLKRALMNQYDRTTAMQVLTAILGCMSRLGGHHVSVLDPLHQTLASCTASALS